MDVAAYQIVDNSGDACDEGRAAPSSTPGSSECGFFGWHSTIHRCMGGGLGMSSAISDHELNRFMATFSSVYL